MITTIGKSSMDLAERLDRLGTETAFAVSAAAADWAARGNRVYPFHLGDINLPTPANIVAAMNEAIAAGKTGYCAAAGIAPLREALAANIGGDRGIELGPANIVVQPGGKPVITKFIQTLMNPGEGVLYPNPGYPIYESQIGYFGGRPLPYRYHETPTGFGIDLDQLRELAPQARLLIYNNLQNPLGCESSAEEMAEIAALAVEHDLWVMSDEAYFEMRYSGTSSSIASLPGMAERTVILYTFSKKFAMTGWRLGCAAAPVPVAEQIAKLNTNDESCTTHFVQAAGVEALRDPSGSAPILAELERRRDAAIDGPGGRAGRALRQAGGDVLSVPQRHRGGRAARASTTSPTSPPRRCTTPACRSAPGTTSAAPSPASASTTSASRTPGISADDITEGIGRLAEWVTSA